MSNLSRQWSIEKFEIPSIVIKLLSYIPFMINERSKVVMTVSLLSIQHKSGFHSIQI